MLDKLDCLKHAHPEFLQSLKRGISIIPNFRSLYARVRARPTTKITRKIEWDHFAHAREAKHSRALKNNQPKSNRP